MAKIYLSNRIEDFTGSLNPAFPYILQKDAKGGFYTRRVRQQEGGFDSSHWDFLRTLVEMCENGLYITDFEVSVEELAEALSEKHACHFLPLQVQKWIDKKTLHAKEFKLFDEWLKARKIG